MIFVSQIDTGIVTRAMTASSGEMENIIASIATTMTTLVSICPSVCCTDWARLSMSLVTRLSTSPRGWVSK